MRSESGGFAHRLAAGVVLGGIGCLLTLAIVLTYVSLRFSPDDPSRFLTVLRHLFPWRSFTYLGNPANLRKLLAGIARTYPFLWLAVIVTSICFKFLTDFLGRLLHDFSELPGFLRQDLTRAWRVMTDDPVICATLVLIVVAGSALRVRYVATDMNCDELLKFFDSSYYGPISTASVFGQEPWHTYSNHLMYLGWQLFGFNHWGIRAHSVTTGCLLIVLTFLFASYLFGRHVGLIAAAFVSCSAVLIAYSVYARNYIHIPFLGMAALLLVDRGLSLRRNAYVYLAAIGTILGLYGLPSMTVFFLTILLLLAAHLIGSQRSDGVPWRVYGVYLFGSILLTALLFIPFIVVSGYAKFVSKLTEQHDPLRLTPPQFLATVWKTLILYHQLLPEWLPSWLWPAVIVAGTALSVVRARARLVLIGVLSMTLVAAWAGMGFTTVRLYTYLIPFFGMAIAIAAIEAWSAPWRARRLPPVGVRNYAAALSILLLVVGLGYSADPENLFGTRMEERVFGRREDRLIVPNAQGVEAMIDYLHKNGLLRTGVLVESRDFTFSYAIRFALLERGYADDAHFSVWRNYPNPRVIYEVYPATVQPPEYLHYQDVTLRRGRVLMAFARSRLVEFL